jgi:hypothetical protein
MEDKDELVSAKDIIIEAAKDLRQHATNAAARALELFIDGYRESQVANRITVCLACFSVARDDESLWKNKDEWRDVCLGVQVLNESGPANQPSALLKVDYSEESWRDNLKRHFGSVCSLLANAEAFHEKCGLGLSALNRIAAKASIGAKQEKYSYEREFRYVTLVTPNSDIQLSERETSAGRKRYLEVSLRGAGKRIAFDEIIIGSNQDTEGVKMQLKSLLADKNYKIGDSEYPQINVSSSPSATKSALPATDPSPANPHRR